MKEELDENSRAALVDYRLQRAKETMQESSLLSENGFYNAAINRLYYACYYASVALLLKNGIQAQTHAGVKTMIGLHFVSTGKLSLIDGKTLSTLFEKRQSGDYDDFIICDKGMVEELTPKAEHYISAIELLLSESESKQTQI